MELEPRSRTVGGLRRYVGLVTEALGCSGDAFWVQPEAPVTAYIPIDDRVPAFPDRDLALLWDERHGWCGAIETASGEDLIVLSYLGSDILPPPRVVARFAAALVAGAGPGQAAPPGFRATDADDDLADRLAAYGPAPEPAYQ
ncbi:DUF6292 family protein [Actinophytocola sp.]|jgi:hypothetical protein|uniref:DUF6292 family protein n=1 Tax=Actinophytocola sp. TaxID=1872138 RepID=UPI002ED7A53F